MIVPQSSSASTMTVERIFYPLHSVRCSGIASYRSQAVRDYACILDVDDDVQSWRCRPVLDGADGFTYEADFLVKRSGAIHIVDVSAADRPVPRWVQDAIIDSGHLYDLVDPLGYPAIRLANAKDLLRYARYEVTLADRVRLLAALDEHHSLTVGECLGGFHVRQPMAVIASLILKRMIDVDLDEGIIGPETIVRRKRD